MPCFITHGRTEQCKDSISGIQALYLVNFGDFDPDPSTLGGDVTYDTTVGFEDQITTIGGTIASIYKYELKGNNGFNTTVNTSRDNGTTFFTQTITCELKRQDPVFHKQFKILAYGRPHVIVRTNGNQFFLAGLYRGCDATSGSIESGVAYGDFNGYKITFEAMEEKPANFLDCASEADLLTLLGSPTLVTN